MATTLKYALFRREGGRLISLGTWIASNKFDECALPEGFQVNGFEDEYVLFWEYWSVS